MPNLDKLNANTSSAASRLFPGDYVSESEGFPGLKLVSVRSDVTREYAIVRFYQNSGEATMIRPVIQTLDCADAKRQYRRLSRSLRLQVPERSKMLSRGR